MRKLKLLIPNLAISLNVALMIVIYLDMRNPMMGFLVGAPFVVLVVSTCASSIACAVMLYAAQRRKSKSAEESIKKQQ